MKVLFCFAYSLAFSTFTARARAGRLLHDTKTVCIDDVEDTDQCVTENLDKFRCNICKSYQEIVNERVGTYLGQN